MKTELYIHIPFCVKKCNYCDFLSFSADDEAKEKYVLALIQQIEQQSHLAAMRDGNIIISSIYMGGGTPSVLSQGQIARIMQTVYRCFDISEDAEVTIEVNPKTADIYKLEAMRQSGFNRISIGLQSSIDEELKMLGRIHNYDEFEECYVNSRKSGFGNVNVDIITALPNQSLDDIMSTISKVIRLRPEHISAYSLIIEPGTPFYKEYSSIDGPVVGQKLERQMYWACTDELARYGYNHYEISNYAQVSYEGHHNSGYWKRVPYIGVGLGASSLIYEKDAQTDQLNPKVSKRFRNVSELGKYIKNPNLYEDEEYIDENDSMNEYAMLGLRMKKGIDIREFEQIFEVDFFERYKDVCNKYQKEKLIEITDDSVRLTRLGIDYGNYVFGGFLL